MAVTTITITAVGCYGTRYVGHGVEGALTAIGLKYETTYSTKVKGVAVRRPCSRNMCMLYVHNIITLVNIPNGKYYINLKYLTFCCYLLTVVIIFIVIVTMVHEATQGNSQ